MAGREYHTPWCLIYRNTKNQTEKGKCEKKMTPFSKITRLKSGVSQGVLKLTGKSKVLSVQSVMSLTT